MVCGSCGSVEAGVDFWILNYETVSSALLKYSTLCSTMLPQETGGKGSGAGSGSGARERRLLPYV